MAHHRITVHPNKPLDVDSADLVIEITSDDQKLGELWISRGSIDWRPRNHTYATTSLSWERFADLMDSVPRRPTRASEHSGKYRPLWEYLADSRASSITMTFADIERVLGFPLPPSSRKHPAHWSGYEGSAVARAISDAGWKATGVDLNAQKVTFVRRG